MSLRSLLIVTVSCIGTGSAVADEVLHLYEGDVSPLDESAGWAIGNPCEDPCSEYIEDGHFVFEWTTRVDLASYDYQIAGPGEEPPPTLWVEWRFRSNDPRPPGLYGCDAKFTMHYGGTHELALMNGDSVVSFSGDDVVNGLDIEEFHTYRYECLDQVNYTVSVDGLIFIVDSDDTGNGYHYLQFGGQGGCTGAPTKNEWDYVRFGTISYGEQIVAADPPAGYLDPEEYPGLDRFTVTFDSANYVYIDEITVEVTGGVAPVVTQVWRPEDAGQETMEIVLDRPIPMGETTTFTFDDNRAVNVVQYTYQLNPIPTVSEWGLVMMTLLILTVGTLVMTRRPIPTRCA